MHLFFAGPCFCMIPEPSQPRLQDSKGVSHNHAWRGMHTETNISKGTLMRKVRRELWVRDNCRAWAAMTER